MTRPALALAALALVTVTACGDGGDGGPPDVSTAGCDSLPTADPAATMPPDFPPLPGAVLHKPSTQGKTVVVFGLLQEGDFVKVRDAYAEQLKAAGWTIDGTDQESVEAEAQFSRKPPLRAGTIKVEPVEGCTGYVTIRFKENL